MPAHLCRLEKREESGKGDGDEGERERLIIITDFSSLCLSITCSLR